MDIKKKRPGGLPRTHFEQISVAAIKGAGKASTLLACIDEAWIQTDLGGFITQLSEKAALLLHVSPHAARGQRLPIFFTGDRPGLYEDMRAVHDRLVIIAKQCTLRPRDRRAIAVTLMLRRVEGDRGHELLWTITRSAV